MLTDDDLFARLTNIEDSTVERKTWSDYRDWARAACAFSNSLSVDQPGVLFVGVHDNGKIETRSINIEEKLKNVTGELSNVYPRINPTILVREKEGHKFIVVIVYGSKNKPHFSGKSYVRKGTQTIDASEENLREFIAQRSGKVAEILKWKGKRVQAKIINPEHVRHAVGRVASDVQSIVTDCNEHWVSLGDGQRSNTYSLDRIQLGFDTDRQQLVIEIMP